MNNRANPSDKDDSASKALLGRDIPVETLGLQNGITDTLRRAGILSVSCLFVIPVARIERLFSDNAEARKEILGLFEAFRQKDVIELGLSLRTANALRRSAIRSLFDLLIISESYLVHMINFPTSGTDEIRQMLAARFSQPRSAAPEQQESEAAPDNSLNNQADEIEATQNDSIDAQSDEIDESPDNSSIAQPDATDKVPSDSSSDKPQLPEPICKPVPQYVMQPREQGTSEKPADERNESRPVAMLRGNLGQTVESLNSIPFIKKNTGFQEADFSNTRPVACIFDGQLYKVDSWSKLFTQTAKSILTQKPFEKRYQVNLFSFLYYECDKNHKRIKLTSNVWANVDYPTKILMNNLEKLFDYSHLAKEGFVVFYLRDMETRPEIVAEDGADKTAALAQDAEISQEPSDNEPSVTDKAPRVVLQTALTPELLQNNDLEDLIPESLIIGSSTITSPENWPELTKQVCELMISAYPWKMKQAASNGIQNIIGGEFILSNNETKNKTCSQLSNGSWLLSKNSPSYNIFAIRKILAKIGIDPATAVLSCAGKDQAEAEPADSQTSAPALEAEPAGAESVVLTIQEPELSEQTDEAGEESATPAWKAEPADAEPVALTIQEPELSKEPDADGKKVVKKQEFEPYEAALLLEGYLEIRAGTTPRKAVIKRVSENLRQMAVNQGMVIDDRFRNEKGIYNQMEAMCSAFFGYTVYQPATKLFLETVEMYRTNRAEYEQLLDEAKEILFAGQVLTRTPQDELIFKENPTLYMKLLTLLRKRYETNLPTISAALLKFYAEHTGQITEIEQILDNVSWATKARGVYSFTDESATVPAESQTSAPTCAEGRSGVVLEALLIHESEPVIQNENTADKTDTSLYAEERLVEEPEVSAPQVTEHNEKIDKLEDNPAKRQEFETYEAVLMLEGYLELLNGKTQRKVIIKRVSRSLRQMAENLGMGIDADFRNVSDISLQMDAMRSVYHSYKANNAASGIFGKAVNLYRTNRAGYEKLLAEAKKKIFAGQALIRTQQDEFFNKKNPSLYMNLYELLRKRYENREPAIAAALLKRYVGQNRRVSEIEKILDNVSWATKVNGNYSFADDANAELAESQVSAPVWEAERPGAEPEILAIQEPESGQSDEAGEKTAVPAFAEEPLDGEPDAPLIQESELSEQTDTAGKNVLEGQDFKPYEAALLLEGYLEIPEGKTPRKVIVSRVSRNLRQMAANRGMVIDADFRSISGISSQMERMRSAYLGYNVILPATKLFLEIVEMYRTNWAGYEQLLAEAKGILFTGQALTRTPQDEIIYEENPTLYMNLFEQLSKRYRIRTTAVSALLLKIYTGHAGPITELEQILDNVSWAAHDNGGYLFRSDVEVEPAESQSSAPAWDEECAGVEPEVLLIQEPELNERTDKAGEESAAPVWEEERKGAEPEVLLIQEPELIAQTDGTGDYAANEQEFEPYEAVLLLEGYLEIRAGTKLSKVIVSCVSENLRKMAVKRGMVINESFRNESSIHLQMESMRSAYLGHTVNVPATKLFIDTVDMYRTNRAGFEQLVVKAKGMNGNTANVRQQFCEWLMINTPEKQPDSVCRALSSAEEFCKKNGVLSASLFETTDIETIKQFVKTVSQNWRFRSSSIEQLTIIVSAASLYYEFIKSLPIIPNVENFEKPTLAAVADVDKIFVVDFDRLQDLAYTRPVSFVYHGYRDDYAQNWADLYIRFVIKLYDDYSGLIPVGRSFTDSGRADLGNEEIARTMIVPKRISKQLFLETNLSATNVVKKIKALLDICNIEYRKVIIEYQNKSPRNKLSDNANQRYVSVSKNNELVESLTKFLKEQSDGTSKEAILTHFNNYRKNQFNNALTECHAVKVLEKYFHKDNISDFDEMADILLDVLLKQFTVNGDYTSAKQLYDDAHIRLGDFFFYNNGFESRQEVYDLAKHLFSQEKYKGYSFLFVNDMHIWKMEPDYPKDYHGLLIKYGRDHQNVFTREQAHDFLMAIGSPAPAPAFSKVLFTAGSKSFLQYDENCFVLMEALHVSDNFLSTLRTQIENLLEGEAYIAIGEIDDYFYSTLPAVPANISWSPFLLEDMLRIFDIGYTTVEAGEDNQKKVIPAAILKKESQFKTFSDLAWNEVSKTYSLPKEFTASEFREFLFDKGFIHGSEKTWNVHKTVAGDLRFYWTENNGKVIIS